MYILMIILKKEKYMDEILTALLNLEVVDVVSIEAESLKNLLGTHLPIFAELKFEIREEKKRKILLSLIDDKNIPHKLCRLLKDSFNIDFENEANGKMVVVPVIETIGSCD